METQESLILQAKQRFTQTYGHAPVIAAYAPGRIEVLGNHTDYNEGYVLSAAIDRGIVFMLAPSSNPIISLTAGNLNENVTLEAASLTALDAPNWANYIIGVAVGLAAHASPAPDQGWNALFLGNIPRGAGLSSSAALEMSAALALGKLWNLEIPPLELAKIGQTAEHEFAGVRCGLLDQLSSLRGREQHLIHTDFRTLQSLNIPMTHDTCFIVIDSGHQHTLADGDYNERRAACEQATQFFSNELTHPVNALRDVSMQDWIDLHHKLPETIARRAAHVIGENTRVRDGVEALQRGDLSHFGFLMFESHHSSMVNFENSCPELDQIVDSARRHPQAIGARLSGGGFGGSAIILTTQPQSAQVINALPQTNSPNRHPLVISPAAGASLVTV